MKISEDNFIRELKNRNPKALDYLALNIRVNIHTTFDGNVNVNFDLPVSREKIQNETIIKRNIGTSIIEDKVKAKLHELKASPLNTSIKYSYDGKLDDNSFINFYTYDDKGRIYIESSGRTDDSGYIISALNSIEEDANKLYIIPYTEVKDVTKDSNQLKYGDLDFYGKFFNLNTKREFDFKEEGKIQVYKTEKND